MQTATVNRRTFLETAVGVVAAVTVAAPCALLTARANHADKLSGAVYGRAGRGGIPPASASGGGRGEVVLIDGTIRSLDQSSQLYKFHKLEVG
jgi:hypothetical protein